MAGRKPIDRNSLQFRQDLSELYLYIRGQKFRTLAEERTLEILLSKMTSELDENDLIQIGRAKKTRGQFRLNESALEQIKQLKQPNETEKNILILAGLEQNRNIYKELQTALTDYRSGLKSKVSADKTARAIKKLQAGLNTDQDEKKRTDRQKGLINAQKYQMGWLLIELFKMDNENIKPNEFHDELIDLIKYAEVGRNYIRDLQKRDPLLRVHVSPECRNKIYKVEQEKEKESNPFKK